MGSGSGPQPQPPAEDRPRDLPDGWVLDEQGTLHLVRAHNPSPSTDDLRKAQAVRKLLKDKPVIMGEVSRFREAFPELAIVDRVRVVPRAEGAGLDVSSLSPEEEAIFNDLPGRLRDLVEEAAWRCKAALRDGRISGDMIYLFIFDQLFPEPIADRLFAGWLAGRVQGVALPPSASAPVWFLLRPGQIAMTLYGASQGDREEGDKGITALQHAWGYRRIDEGGRPTNAQDEEKVALEKVAARLDAILFPDKMIGLLLGVSETTAGRYVRAGRAALTADEGPNWLDKLKEKFPDLRLPKRRSPPSG